MFLQEYVIEKKAKGYFVVLRVSMLWQMGYGVVDFKRVGVISDWLPGVATHSFLNPNHSTGLKFTLKLQAKINVLCCTPIWSRMLSFL